MAHRLLDADAEAQRAPGEGVEDVHEVSVVRGEPPVGVLALEVRAGGIQT